jgi:hypothetical protein
MKRAQPKFNPYREYMQRYSEPVIIEGLKNAGLDPELLSKCLVEIKKSKRGFFKERSGEE